MSVEVSGPSADGTLGPISSWITASVGIGSTGRSANHRSGSAASARLEAWVSSLISSPVASRIAMSSPSADRWIASRMASGSMRWSKRMKKIGSVDNESCIGSDQHDLRCWRGELEPDIVDQFRTVGGGGACRNLNDVVGRCWNAVDCTWLVFETRGLCAKPDPPAGHFWRDRDGDMSAFSTCDTVERATIGWLKVTEMNGAKSTGPSGWKRSTWSGPEAASGASNVGRRRECLVDRWFRAVAGGGCRADG